MRLLRDAFEYNGWATRQLGEVCQDVPQGQLTGKEDWQYQSIMGLWRHINEVERAYFRMTGGGEVAEAENSLDGYLVSSSELKDGFVSFAGSLDGAGLETMFRVPWFERDFTIGDGLFQVLAHSIEHRADIAHFLSRLGHETPPIDYVMWIYLRDGGRMP
jgi:uncharacterized damage-inducible protein DinB